MDAPSEAGAVCAKCHAPMGTDGRCLPCLLRGGLLEVTVVDPTRASALPPAAGPDTAVYGDFEITRRDDGTLWELGHGAMGVTYRAVDRTLHRPVALKVIQFGATPANGNDSSVALRERFLREARAAAALRHANIAGVFHFGADDGSGQCYYAMELVEGETLEARVRRNGPLDANTTLEIAAQVAAALVAAANRGLIHRDLKPSNLMLGEGNAPARLEVKVIDFGLAKAVATAGEIDLTHGGFVGTPAFASPEQFECLPVDSRTDIYSLGVTLWYTLTGRVPFAGRTLDELRFHPARQTLPVEQLTARKVPPAVVSLLRAMLAEDPAERPASARELVAALENCRATRADQPRPDGRRPGKALVMRATLGTVLAGVGLIWWMARPPRQGVASVPADNGPTAVISEKSVAVLPFENRSDDKANGFFTDGVQDEILTDLAKVADLKVISRTSVMQYRGSETRNLRDIAAQLGVAHVVEGSVQRAGNEVRVNAQLIDARTDAHEWAAHYDKTLDNVFTVQTEVASAIAEQLRAHISPEEHQAMAEVPTKDVLALQLYQQAKELESRQADPDAREGLLQAVDLLEQAVKRDPNFLSAYCLLSRVHLALYWEDFDHTDARREEGRAALAQAVRLKPLAGETHLAQANYAYHGFRDYDRALAELALARRSLPNSAEVAANLAFIYRRQGRWEECIRELESAAELDPRNFNALQETGFTHAALRHYADAARYYQRALTVVPGDMNTRESVAMLALCERADLEPLRALNAAIVAGNKSAELESSAYFRLLMALAERDAVTARAALASFPVTGAPDNTNAFLPREWYAGSSASRFGDPAAAKAEFAAARDQMERRVRAQPDYAEAWSALGRIDAALDRKDEALREGRQAVALLPLSRDAWDGPGVASNLAAIYARTGETDLAIQELDRLVHLKGGNDFQEISFGGLKLDPRWEPLRDDRRFQALVAALAPK